MRKAVSALILLGVIMFTSCSLYTDDLKTFVPTQMGERHLISFQTDFGFCFEYFFEEYSISKTAMGGVRLTNEADNGFSIGPAANFQENLSALTELDLMKLIENQCEIVTLGEYEIKTIHGIERVSFGAACLMRGEPVVIKYVYFNFAGVTYCVSILADGDDLSLMEPYDAIVDTICSAE